MDASRRLIHSTSDKTSRNLHKDTVVLSYFVILPFTWRNLGVCGGRPENSHDWLITASRMNLYFVSHTAFLQKKIDIPFKISWTARLEMRPQKENLRPAFSNAICVPQMLPEPTKAGRTGNGKREASVTANARSGQVGHRPVPSKVFWLRMR